MRLPHRLTTIAVAGCLALTAASCGGGDKPAPKPTTSTSKSTESKAAPAPSKSGGPGGNATQSATPTVDPKVKKPVRSDYRNINTKTDDGAAAALEYFVDGYRFALLTGDASVLKEASAVSCDVCNRMIVDTQDDSRRLSRADWKTDDIRVYSLSAERKDASLHVDSSTLLANGGHPQNQAFIIGTIMQWERGRWTASNASLELEDE